MTIPELIEAARELDVLFFAGQDPRPLQQIGTYRGVVILGYDQMGAEDAPYTK